ncbi:RsmB/NOP family class I SAM-dependent RNA methyltransferase [Desulfovibrio sp. OttesenSCG-928-A18]|nr:RsmB/NOP family class I SAM-dependent RNA methyltransferase [Desulfovibrio sp. OttesenSCG-928-A18]
MSHTTSTQACRSFRLVCPQERAGAVEALLAAEGFSFSPEPFFPLARRLLHEPFPLGASLAARFGYIYIQDRSSMLPPLALRPPDEAAVLDMCASPGSKTGMLGQLVGMNGFVLGNEPSPKRLNTLRRNLQAMNLLCCATCSHPGEALPLPGGSGARAVHEAESEPAAFSRILLDPPCSGWGTAEKNPRVTSLWQGDKVKPLIGLQRKLLAEAARLLSQGGFLSYSTCTTNVAENEEQLRYARDELGLECLALPELPGFSFMDSPLPDVTGAWRVQGGDDGQGFFVALLHKPFGQCKPARAQRDEERGPLSVAAGGPLVNAGVRGRGAKDRAGNRRDKAAQRLQESEGCLLAPDSIASEGVDAAKLPEGLLAVFGQNVYFLPVAAQKLLAPQNTRLVWKGFALGRMGRNGRVHVSAYLRALMPTVAEARNRAFAVLDLEDCRPLHDMVSGRGIALDALAPASVRSFSPPLGTGGGIAELGLYFQGLPLCRLQLRGRRALLPPG